MAMSGPDSPPPAPDPVATANAQGVMNQSTATTQQLLNQTNQVTPDGSLTYNQTGNNSFTDANGKTVTVPQFTATTALSDSNQGIYDTNQITKGNIANIGKDQSARIGDLLGTPLKLGNEATEARLMELGSKRLDPRFARDEEALRTRLANSGIRAGSDAFNSEMTNFGNTKNDAITSLLLAGRGQANTELMAERSAPINEVSALLSGSQVGQPNFQTTPQSQVAGVDYTGLVNNQYNAQMSAYNAEKQSNAAMMGGMFGMAGNLGGMGIYKYSDRRLKTDIEKIGKLPSGDNVYSYRYKGSDEPDIGVMAQEVEKRDPAAVVADAVGRKMVDYSRVLEAQ